MAGASAIAQQKTAPTPGVFHDKLDFGLNYTYKLAKGSTAPNGYFIQGASFDAAYTPGGRLKGLGLAVDVNDEYAKDIYPSVDLRKLTYVAGPRYTLRGPRASLYVESLFGVDIAYDTVIYSAAGFQSAARSFSSQYGGGLNLNFAKHVAWRVAALDYVFTTLPNDTGTNRQSATRLSSGIAFHF
jgi:hypothetical protein